MAGGRLAHAACAAAAVGPNDAAAAAGAKRCLVLPRERLTVRPSRLSSAWVERRLVRLSPRGREEVRTVLVSPTDGAGYVQLRVLCKAKARTSVWVAARLVNRGGAWLASGEEVVVKESSLRDLEELDLTGEEDPLAELAALQLTSHPGHAGVVALLDAFLSPSHSRVFVVLPHIRGKDLFEVLKETNKGRGLPEEQVRGMFRQLVSALLYLKHDHRMRHGDLSPENVMVDEEGNATLIDFGMAAGAPAGAVGGAEGDGVRVLMAAGPRRGKRQYMAPEVYMERDHDPFAPDVFSLGVCLYVLLTGCAAFKSPLDSAYKAVLRGQARHLFEERERKGGVTPLSPEALSLISLMLNPDPLARPSMEEVSEHRWVQGVSGRGAARPACCAKRPIVAGDDVSTDGEQSLESLVGSP